MQKLFLLMVMPMVMAVGCATSPDKIPAQYVSPLIYKDYDEDQIVHEMDHIGRRTGELYASLKKKATGDKWQMGLGLLLFWPALFALEGGDGPEAQEYARLRGQYEALRQVAIQKKINLESLPPSPEDIVEKEKARIKKQAAKKKPGGKRTFGRRPPEKINQADDQNRLPTDIPALKRLAEKGDAMAQNSLGSKYAKGEGVLEDDMTAYAWWNIAAANGNLLAKTNKDLAAKTMTPESVIKAQELSKEMLKKNPKLLISP